MNANMEGYRYITIASFMVETQSYASHALPHPEEDAAEFAYPEDKGCREDYDYPILKFEGNDVEEVSADGDNDNLTDKDDSGYHQEFATGMKVESAAMGCKRTGIEKVPELQHHECGEDN